MSDTNIKLPNGVSVLAGATYELERRVSAPFAADVKNALDALSKLLLTDSQAKEFPDIVTFAFWCRRANIAKKESEWIERASSLNQLGRGLMFHVAPSNVPINFAYSFVFSLLAGNCNIVRVPSKKFVQIDIIVSALKVVFGNYPDLQASNTFIRYTANNEITSQLSSVVDGRVIWGGDATVMQIRSLPASPRCIDVVFPDRYSIALMRSDSLVSMNEEALQKLVASFYNDTYLMDQNACSSPQVLFWIGENKDSRERFWRALSQHAQNKYDLQSAVSVDKYVKLCEDIVGKIECGAQQLYQPYLTHVDITHYLQGNSVSLSEFRGTGGYFYEAVISNVSEAMLHITKKYQTIVYFGLNSSDIEQALIDAQAKGVDRIIPVGEALDIDIIWDGYDLIGLLSRIIQVR